MLLGRVVLGFIMLDGVFTFAVEAIFIFIARFVIKADILFFSESGFLTKSTAPADSAYYWNRVLWQ